MATFNRVNTFTLNLGQGLHTFGSDQLVVALTAAANPPVATNTVLTNLTQISYTNLSSRNLTTTSFTQTGGLATLVLADLVLTASGNVATFRYVAIYNDTAPNDELIGWIDYASNISMVSGDTFTLDFTATPVTL